MKRHELTEDLIRGLEARLVPQLETFFLLIDKGHHQAAVDLLPNIKESVLGAVKWAKEYSDDIKADDAMFDHRRNSASDAALTPPKPPKKAAQPSSEPVGGVV